MDFLLLVRRCHVSRPVKKKKAEELKVMKSGTQQQMGKKYYGPL
jgi:hypothetical protein